jgi:hypothetical protein
MPSKDKQGVDQIISEISILLQEYEEVCNEVRYRDRIIHNSYYLLVIIFGVFAQGTLGFIRGGDLLASAAMAGSAGGAFLFLSFIIYTYNERRLEAMMRRFEVSQIVNDQYDDHLKIQHILYPDLPYHRYQAMARGDRSLMSIGPRFISYVIAIGASGWILLGTITFLISLGVEASLSVVSAAVVSTAVAVISLHILSEIDINPNYSPDIDTDSIEQIPTQENTEN